MSGKKHNPGYYYAHFFSRFCSGFQLIGQTTLKDYLNWVEYFSKQEKTEQKPQRIVKRAYARVGVRE